MDCSTAFKYKRDNYRGKTTTIYFGSIDFRQSLIYVR